MGETPIFKTAIADKYDLDGMYGARFALKCDAGRNGAWKCEADIELRQYLNDNINFTEECKDVCRNRSFLSFFLNFLLIPFQERFCFTANSDIWELQCDWVWFRMSYWVSLYSRCDFFDGFDFSLVRTMLQIARV